MGWGWRKQIEDAQFHRLPAEPVGPELVPGPLIRPAALPDAERDLGWLPQAQAELFRHLELELGAVLCRPPEPVPVLPEPVPLHRVPARHRHHHHLGHRLREPEQPHRAHPHQVQA